MKLAMVMIQYFRQQQVDLDMSIEIVTMISIEIVTMTSTEIVTMASIEIVTITSTEIVTITSIEIVINVDNHHHTFPNQTMIMNIKTYI